MNGGFLVHVGPIRRHSDDVEVVQNEFHTGVSSVLQETLATEVAFGVLWAPATLPVALACATSISDLTGKVSQSLHDLSIRIDATADVYDKGEAKSKALVERNKPDVTSVTDVLTNDTFFNLAKNESSGKDSSVDDIVTPDGGILSDGTSYVNNLTKAIQGKDVDPIDIISSAGNLAFDILGFASDPLASIAGSFVGYIIDLIPPLKEFLDLTLGDPDALQEISGGWDKLAKWFVDCGDRYQESMQANITPDVWSGDAANAYINSANATIDLLGQLGHACENVSTVVLVFGSIIGDTRGIIVGKVTEFILIQAGLFATADAAAIPTCGGSIAAFFEEFFAWLEFETAEIITLITTTLTHLAEVGAKGYLQQQAFDQYAQKLAS